MNYTSSCYKCSWLICHNRQWIWTHSTPHYRPSHWYNGSLDNKVLKGMCLGCIRVYAHIPQVGLLVMLQKLGCCSPIVDFKRDIIDLTHPLFISSLNSLGDKLISKRKLERFIEIRDSRGEEV